MSELKEMIVEVVEKIIKSQIDKEAVDLLELGQWAQSTWSTLQKQELHRVAMPEAQGGAGGDFEDLLALYRVMGQYAAPLPFVEHTLAHFLAQQVGVTLEDTLATYDVKTALQLEDETVTGTIEHVPWASYAEQLVALAQQGGQRYIVVLPLQQASQQVYNNIAGEPRATVMVDQVRMTKKVAISAEQYAQLTQYVTAATVSKMSGALYTACQLTIQFSQEREQFGRPIHRFQLVQQHIAQLVGERAIIDAALSNLQALFAQQRLQDEVAYARLRIDEASRIVATSANQVNAAIGVTHEHRLHQYTRRLWAWRDEDFTARYWQKQLAQVFIAAEQPLWEMLTAQTEGSNHK